MYRPRLRRHRAIAVRFLLSWRLSQREGGVPTLGDCVVVSPWWALPCTSMDGGGGVLE